MTGTTSAILAAIRWLEIASLVPLAAAWVNQRSRQFQQPPWMPALVSAIAFNLVVRAVLMGTALEKIRNHWVSNLALLPSFLLMAWVVRGIGGSRRAHPGLLAVPLLIAFLAAWEARQVGFDQVWNRSATAVSMALLALALWEMGRLLRLDAAGPFWSLPGFWVLSAWVLDNGTSVVFHSLFEFFLKKLTKPWLLVPWLVVFFLGALFNVILAKAFLCPKPRSS